MRLATFSLAASLLLIPQSGAYDGDIRKDEVDGAEEAIEMDFSIDSKLIVEFELWMENFEKKYECAQEKFKRMKIWIENHFLIEEHNQQVPKPSFEMGHNPYSDLTQEEFRKMFRLGEFSPGVPDSYSSSRRSSQGEQRIPDFDMETSALRGVQRIMKEESDVEAELEEDDLPAEIDWRGTAVTSVKNQGHCGSCWAFSAVGAIEGMMGAKNGKAVSLSVQELVDCDKTDLGCMGGLMDKAFLFEEGLSGLCSWEDYTYDSPHIDGKYTCKKADCDAVPGSGIKSFKDVDHNSDKALMKALSQQPVSVAIQANQLQFQFYKKGVFDIDCGTKLDHGVLAVGYGTEEGEEGEDGKNFYLIKNSWGDSWGDEGYIKLVRGKVGETQGHCGVLELPSYPVE